MTDYVRRLRELLGPEPVLQVPSVAVALRDLDGRVLVARHADAPGWLLPGGAIEPGEPPADAALREMWEETGALVRLTRLVGVFGGAEFVVHYRNGHRTSYVTTVFEAQCDRGQPRADGAELLELRYVSAAEASALPLATWVPEVLAAVFRPSVPGFRAPAWGPPLP